MKSIIFLIFLAVSNGSALSEENPIQLFSQPNTPVRYYADVVSGLRVDDKIRFSNRRTFKIVRRISSGQQAYIIKVDGGGVLRIPKYVGTLRAQQAWAEGHAILAKTTTPIPALIENYGDEYSLIEEFDVVFALQDYTKQRMYGTGTTPRPFLPTEFLFPRELAKIRSDLLRFAGLSSEVRWVGDFDATQIGYTREKGWVLLDWSTPIELAEKLGDGHFLISYSDRHDVASPYIVEAKEFFLRVLASRFSSGNYSMAGCSDIEVLSLFSGRISR